MKEPPSDKPNRIIEAMTKAQMNPEHPEADGLTQKAGGLVSRGLAKNGIISPDESALLGPARISEVMIRFAEGLTKLGEASDDQRKKIRRILGLGAEQGDALPQPESRQEEIEKLVGEMRRYLKAFQAEVPAVVGMVLCGSRMDKDKLPDQNSDVDAVLIMKTGTETDPRTPEGEKMLFALRGFSDSHNSESGFPVEIDEIYAADKFIQALESTEENSRLIWGWNPEALAYIGDRVEDMNEDDVGSFLSLELKSEKADDLRRKMIKRAAEKIITAKP